MTIGHEREGRPSWTAPLAALHASARDIADRFLAAENTAIEAYRREVSAGIGEALRELGDEIEQLTGGNPTTCALVQQASAYVDAMQWVLWDLPCFAAVMRPDPGRFRRVVSACGLVYLSFRVLDDLIDRHHIYRGKHPTLLSTFSASDGRGRISEELVTLAVFLLCFDGLSRLAGMLDAGGGASTASILQRVIGSARRTIVGAILERSEEHTWTLDYYERLVHLKNVDYWRVLNAALDPTESSPLYPFLMQYYAVAQRLNDVQDHAADEVRGQPNLLTILRRQSVRETKGEAPSIDAADMLVDQFLALGSLLDSLPERERGAAALKLSESLDEARRLGLCGFEPLPLTRIERASAGEGPPSLGGIERASARLRPDVPGLVWTSTAEEFLERFGAGALEDSPCDVCGEHEQALLFRAQGFAYQRCAGCSHVRVHPRVRLDIHTRIAEESDAPADDPFLEVQRMHAEYLCRVLRRFARGPRLLDVGFGRGYLMHLAQAYGFEAYGVEGSSALSDALRPVFGRRLHRATVGDAPLPWGQFDVVVMSHVLEHMHAPQAALRHVRAALNNDGLLYVAVPDMDSIQFKIFGKRWNAISPVVHLQNFTERSLRHVLEAAGFEILSRLQHPPEPAALTNPAKRLFRDLGGTESGELAMLCRAAASSSAAPSEP